MSIKVVENTAVTVTTAGTRVQVNSTATPISSIIFQAASGNASGVFVGSSAVSSANGIRLTANQTFAVSGDNRRGFADEFVLSDFYCDSEANGDKVHVIYIKQRN